MQIHELNAVVGTPTDTSVFAIDTGTNTLKIDYASLAQAIVETYAGSTLAGSSQSVQSAIAALLASITANAGDIDTLEGTVYNRTSLGSATNANNITTNGTYWINAANVSNLPVDSGYGFLRVSGGDGTILQEFNIHSSSVKAMPRTYTRIYTNSQWYSWNCNNGKVLTKSVTGSTSGQGSISSSLAWTQYAIVAAHSAGYICIPYRASSGSNLYIKVLDTSLTPVASTSVSINVAYIDLGESAFS